MGIDIKAYWNELNEMFGTNLEMPEEIKFDVAEFHNDLAMGASFDSAMQRNMN